MNGPTLSRAKLLVLHTSINERSPLCPPWPPLFLSLSVAMGTSMSSWTTTTRSIGTR